jgi:hypothetical protein
MSIPMAKEDSAGRMSWDETALLVAIKGYSNYYTLHQGRMKVADDGSDSWNDSGKGQAYLVEKIDHHKVEKLIDKLIQHQPVLSRKRKD